MKLHELVKQYRHHYNMSQRQFATACGLSNGYISMLEDNRNPKTGEPIVPSLPTLRKIATGMHITINELVASIDDMPVDLGVSSASLINCDENSSIDALPSNIIPIRIEKVPLLGSIAAGEPILAQEEFDTYIEADADIRCNFALRVDGDSMAPTINYGDVVFIRKQDDVEEGQIAAVLIDDSATLKRVYYIPNGVHLLSDNPKYPPMIFTLPDCDTIRILGRAVAFKRML